MRTLIGVILTAVLVLAAGAAGADVKVYLDETRTKFVMADTLDCKVYEGKRGITIGFKASTCFFNFGPEFTLGGQQAINWDKSVQMIIARYKELCTRFNAGALTMKEYKERLEQIDNISKEAMEFQDRMMQRVKAESKEAFKELDSETKGANKLSQAEISRTISSIEEKVNQLP